MLKKTDRYKEARNTLNEAKKKYSVHGDIKTNINGHSLGGAISGYIANKKDNVYTLDKGVTIGQKIRSNENAFRTSGDAVSIFNSGSKNMKTLNNYNKSSGFVGTDILKAHNVDNIKNNNININ
jgi:hypothetical protein